MKHCGLEIERIRSDQVLGLMKPLFIDLLIRTFGSPIFVRVIPYSIMKIEDVN